MKESPTAPAEKKNPFLILKEMSEKNMDIQIAPLSNIIESRMNGGKGWIKIGVPADIVLRLAKGEGFMGGLLLANTEQFESLQNSIDPQ